MNNSAAALLAFWNDVDPTRDAAYNDWHGGEHVPQRCRVPGVLWAQRYGQAGCVTTARYLTLYGLRDARVLGEDAYLALLREPTPASRAMRPALRNLSRWVCRLHQCHLSEATDALLVSTSIEAPSVADVLVLSERLQDASPLPWTTQGQERERVGHWLLCRAADGMDPTGALPTGAVRYERLPAGC
ncbi:hypothetical protein [Verminephrobacter aporrectodeae]|uniref:hypothetical protein n=1 Tax=Verminephrobacter aporrectodeae TaxID=1110389 RepID=UPI002243B015|nr:hypothetical protein [Verminephrobacter aporrectodeae]